MKDGHVAGLRSGKEYLSSLRDGRKVIIGDRVVDDVASDPATSRMATFLAELLDAHLQDERLLDGDGLPLAYSLARAQADVVARGGAFEVVARRSGGLLGRSPDFLATILTSWRAAADYFGEYSSNVIDYWERCRATNAVLTHAISDPPGDRYLPVDSGRGQQTLKVVAERDAGIVVAGAKMLATLAPFADELLIYPFRPLDDDEGDKAICFWTPLATDGLTMFSRPSFAAESPLDRPFAARLDELDAICVFDDVLIPWERVFIYRDVSINNQLRDNTGMTAYAWHQSSVRAWIKSALVFALAQACSQASGRAANDSTRRQLGELAGIAETLRSLVKAAEAGSAADARDYFVCELVPLATAAMVNSTLYARAVELLQLVGSSSLIMHPLAGDEEPGGLSHDFFAGYFAGDGVTAAEHGRLLRAAADLALDRFGARQVLYERVFVGPPDAFRAKFYDIYCRGNRGDDEILRALIGLC